MGDALLAVFSEMAFQYEEGFFDDQAIADSYSTLSAVSLFEAQVIARCDEEDAREIYNDPKKQLHSRDHPNSKRKWHSKKCSGLSRSRRLDLLSRSCRLDLRKFSETL